MSRLSAQGRDTTGATSMIFYLIINSMKANLFCDIYNSNADID